MTDLIGLAGAGRAAINFHRYLRGATMSITADPDYVELANRFREGFELEPDDLQRLLRHALENLNYMLARQVQEAMDERGMQRQVIEELSRAPVRPANERERQAYRNAAPLDNGEEM